MKKLFKAREWLALGLFALFCLAFFWKFFFKGLVPIPADLIVGIYFPWRDQIWNGLVAGVPFKNGLLSDVVSIIYPWRIYGIELFKNGVWPLWSSQALAGAPLLANFQSGLFYPLNFLFWVFSNANAWSVYIILQPLLGGFFLFLFLKNLKLGFLPSLIGGFVFAFSGFMLVWLEYGIVGHAGLWLPLILLGIDKLLVKQSILWVVVGAASVGFSILAGYPQISLFVLLTAFFYAAFKVLSLSGEKRKRVTFFLIPLFLLGILLAFVQLLPGWELWQLSLRQVDISAAAFNWGLNPIRNLVLFLAPDFYGNPATGNFWGSLPYNEAAFYVGVASFLLAIIAFFSFSKLRVLTFFKLLLVFSLLMVFANPFSEFIFGLKLPFLASSSAGRFFFLMDFSLAILAAFGAQVILEQKKFGKMPIFAITAVFVSFSFVVGAVFLRPEFLLGEDLLANLAVVRRNLILPTLIMTASLFLFLPLLFKRFFNFRKIILVLAFFLIVFDLFRFGFKYTPFTNREYLYPETKLTNFLKGQEGLYRFYGLIPQSMFMPYNLSSPEGYEPLMIKRYGELANQINEEEFKEISLGSRWVIVNRHESPLLNLMGVKYLLSHNAEPVSDWDAQYFKYPEEKYKLIFQHGRSQVYENRQVLPRVFIVHNFRVLGEEQILKTLMSGDFTPRETLLLEEEPKQVPEARQGLEQATVNEEFYFQNKVLIETDSSSDGFLILTDNYYPGWQAFVDGEQTKIYRADYTFKAVFLPEGKHRIEFLFYPQSFKIGGVISLLALTLLIALIVYEIKSRYLARKSSA